ncbi:uncharacterized protein [Physcomitrium patens]|uniref:Uncharacterized protein n=1 Tax=Physcomitrium patens TaxID=3218 RepID=A0A7I4CSW5_PHYPA|nr:uncharacterized protein LOC112277637 isoform X2 [Physcomitrium patens]|eukprot:XP_024365951.1 uncharacterized protein LOC112277637 isoform X2 [Physcomitrella patens]
MSSTNAPYATLHDLPKWEKRADVGQAPWCQDQTAFKSSRGHDPLPYVACNSRTAPFATFHNIPNQGGAISERSVPVLESPAVQQVRPSNGSLPSHELRHSTPYGTCDAVDHRPTQLNLSKVHQAPWDRDDVHHKVQPRFPHGEDAPHYTSSHAPYATDSQRG